ncbi:MAG: hypothetical protein ABSF22_16585 [Bryobacteraceae bacterium]
MRNRHGVSFVLLLVSFALAQPGPSYVPCLDTMAINSAEVFVVTIADLCTPAHCSQDNNVIVNVEEHLKGDPGDRFQFRIDAPPATLADWKDRGSRLLIFDHLGSDRSWGNAKVKTIDLSVRDLQILTADMSVLVDPGEILRAAKEAIGRHRNVYGMVTFSRSIPPAIARQLGVAVWLKTTVPADSDLERWALNALDSKQDDERSEAADALGYFPSDANAARLRPLLDDPALSNNGYGNVNIYLRSAKCVSVVEAHGRDGPGTRAPKGTGQAIAGSAGWDRPIRIGIGTLI